MISVEAVVPKDYFIAILGREEKEDGGSQCVWYYVGSKDLNERDPHAKITDTHESDVVAAFTTTFGRSTTFKSQNSAARFLMSDAFRRGFIMELESDGFKNKLDKDTIAIYSYGAQHVTDICDINPMDLLEL